MVREQAYDVIGEEYLFIRPCRVGHALESEVIAVVVDVQVKGGAMLLPRENIGGSGQGDWYAVFCAEDALGQLAAAVTTEEARRRALLPELYLQKRKIPRLIPQN